MNASGPRGGGWLRVALFALAALFVAGGIAFRATAPEPPAPAAAGGEAAAEVAVQEIARREGRDRVMVPAVLEARRSVTLASETSGRVESVGAETLDAVEAGQVLARIDPVRAQLAAERAEAAITRARSELALARTSLERQQSLKERDVTSESTFDDASNRARVAQAALRDARAQLAEARDELARKTIAAPFGGVLRSFDVEAGEVLSPGQRLGELLDLSTARARVGLSDRQVVGLASGMPVALRVEALPNRTFEGRVLRVGSAIDPDSRKFPVEVEVENPDGALLPGMVAQVSLDLPAASRLLVPREAVVDELGLSFVYVVAEGDDGALRAERRRVTVQARPFEPRQMEVVAGLREGERIAVSGVQALRDGAPIRMRGVALRAGPPEAGEG